MSSSRRIALGVGLVALLAALAVAAAWLFWVPAAVRERVVEAAARRGLEADVGAVHPGLSDVALSELTLTGGDGAVEMRVARLSTGAGLFALASEGTAAIERLRLRDVRATVDLASPELDTTLRALRGRSSAPSTSEPTGRAIEVEGLQVTVRDRDGALLSIERGRVRLGRDGIARVTLGPLELAPGEPDGVSVARTDARIERGDEGWRLASLRLGQAQVHYREREGEDRSPLWSRLRRHGDTIAGWGDGDDRAEESGGDGRGGGRPSSGASASDERGDPAPDDGDGARDAEREGPPADGRGGGTRPAEEGGATSERDRRGGARSPGDDGPAAGAEPGPDAGGSSEPRRAGRSVPALLVRALTLLGPRLAPGATLALDDLAVVVREDGDERPVLRGLEAEVRALPRGRYQLEGSGRPGRGGRLGWDVTVDPEALRAEGSVDFQRLPFVLLVPVLPDLPWHHPEDTRLSGQLSIRGDEGGSRMHLEGDVTVEDLALSSPRIAPDPVRRVGLFLSGEADWVPLDRRLEIARMELGMGEARAHLRGSLEWPADHYLVDVRATLPPTDCNAAVEAIPADLLAEATAFTFRGRIGGQVVAQIDSRALDDTELSIRVANGCVFETAPAMADVRRFEGPFTHRVVEPDGTTFEMETGPGTARWTPLPEISPFLIHAVLGHEDAGFFRHAGFSTSSIRLALVRNLRTGRYVYGASTITMQLVKNVFLHREKTLARKVQEVILTWWLESVMDKPRILELYLNVIEYGPAVYGIRAAAQHYFGREPARLGPAESAYLATILPNPKAFHSHWEEDALPARHRRRVARFLRTLGDRDRYDEAAVAHALERLETLDFHHPGEPLPPEREIPGGTAPLPEGAGADLDQAWEDALGPDDPHAGEPLPGEGLAPDPRPGAEAGDGA
ncbi:MAG TPA: transglycosylase domain-containing protein [Sandaracinaceae bacterium LLY-WYZ-13_1]|nr:transglycosylase domain-containing protein [Sandaracinaceae bacterium LLY-WYZ-13_1]